MQAVASFKSLKMYYLFEHIGKKIDFGILSENCNTIFNHKEYIIQIQICYWNKIEIKVVQIPSQCPHLFALSFDIKKRIVNLNFFSLI